MKKGLSAYDLAIYITATRALGLPLTTWRHITGSGLARSVLLLSLRASTRAPRGKSEKDFSSPQDSV
jgi:hypothetical protein